MTRAQRLKAVGLAVFLASCFGIAMVLTNVSGIHVVPGYEPYRVQVVLPNSVALTQNSDVREAGVRIGTVKRLSTPGNEGPQHMPSERATIAELELDGSHSPIYRDATALVRSKSIAQENYVELATGHPGAGVLPSRGVIPIDHVREATQFDEITSIFDVARRKRLQHVLDGLGTGLRGRHGGDLNRFFGASYDVTDEGAPVAAILADDRAHVAGLVDSFGRVTRALGDRRDALRTFTRSARVTAESAASREAQLRAFLRQLPPFLGQARQTATRLTGFSQDATPVLHDLRLATEDLVPAVQDLRPAAAAGRRTVAELDRFARVATPAMRQLEPFSRRAASEFDPPLEGFLRELNPLSSYLSPYWRELSTFFANNAGWTSFRDDRSYTLRITTPISQSNFPGLVTPEQERAFQSLEKRAGLDTRNRNAYPPPGTAGNPRPFSGDYPRLQRDPPYSR